MESFLPPLSRKVHELLSVVEQCPKIEGDSLADKIAKICTIDEPINEGEIEQLPTPEPALPSEEIVLENDDEIPVDEDRKPTHLNLVYEDSKDKPILLDDDLIIKQEVKIPGLEVEEEASKHPSSSDSFARPRNFHYRSNRGGSNQAHFKYHDHRLGPNLNYGRPTGPPISSYPRQPAFNRGGYNQPNRSPFDGIAGPSPYFRFPSPRGGESGRGPRPPFQRDRTFTNSRPPDFRHDRGHDIRPWTGNRGGNFNSGNRGRGPNPGSYRGQSFNNRNRRGVNLTAERRETLLKEAEERRQALMNL
ncbi:uncharacterized protein LOC141851691 [Brevipalpus obovatus]|uniref:uncharacterized protein LOC141851691 n=1 Tax=Brevipalpus obovatus TaxID=246614 RepID=UPI003D9F8823